MKMSESANVFFLYIFDFAEVRPVPAKVTDTHTHAHTYSETDKPTAIGEILQICLKTSAIDYMALLKSQIDIFGSGKRCVTRLQVYLYGCGNKA